MSSTEEEPPAVVSEDEFSPPTSPVAQTFSPATSPAHRSSDSDSDKAPETKQRRLPRGFARTSLLRLRRGQIQCNEFDGNGGEAVERPSSNTSCPSAESCSNFTTLCYQTTAVPNYLENPLVSTEGEVSDDTSEEEEENQLSSSDELPNTSDNEGSMQMQSSQSSLDLDGYEENHSDHSDNDSANSDVSDLFENSDVSTSEAILLVLNMYLEERWTKKSLEKKLKMIKRLLPKPNEMPSSSYALFSMLESLTSCVSSFEHFYCSECYSNDIDENGICTNCGGCKDIGVFFSFPFEDQIKQLFEVRGLADVLDRQRDCNENRKEGYICDFQDGSEYKNIKLHLSGPYDTVWIWNVDGVSLSSSSKQELWCIVSKPCDVSPQLRSSFMIVSGIFVGKHKPKMNVYLKPFMESLRSICHKGGVSWVHPTTKILYKSLVVAPILCADAPAKAIALNVKQYNARYGCNICEQKSRKVPAAIEKDRTKRRFLFREDSARLRSGERMKMQGDLAERRGKSRKGVIGDSVTTDIPGFDRARSVCGEYLHLFLLGVAKYFLKKIFFERGPWYIGHAIKEIDVFISDIKVPDNIRRLPRGISDLNYFKASEFRAFVLFYSLPIFKGRLSDNYFQHWLLFVGALHILLGDSISENDACAAEVMLRCFVRDVAHLYGEDCYTYNVHSLLHVVLQVRRWGPLWCTSAFDFEDFCGRVTRLIHGTKHLGKELLNNIKIMQNVAILENIVQGCQLNLTNHELRMKSTQSIKKPMKYALSQSEFLALADAGLETGKYSLYSRAKILSEIYTSRFYDQSKKRSNSFVQFCSGDGRKSYGEILIIVKAGGENSQIFCLLEVFKIIHVNIFFHRESMYKISSLLPVENSGKLITVRAEDIGQKVLKVGDYLAMRPNPYEVNL